MAGSDVINVTHLVFMLDHLLLFAKQHHVQSISAKTTPSYPNRRRSSPQVIKHGRLCFKTHEVNELMSIDALCNLTKPVNDDDEDDEADDNQTSNDTILVTPESINELATKLKSMSVDIGKMGPEFANAAMEVEDASDSIVPLLGR